MSSEERTDSGAEPRASRRLRFGRVPDPARAHGAWAYLILSILAGTLTATGRGFVPALLVGVGFAGVFLCASSAALVGKRGMASRLTAGLLLAIVGPGTAVYLGASPSFFAFSLVAIAPAALAGYCAEKSGIMSPQAMAFAVVALAIAAPSSACAGGASATKGLLLLMVLAPFFAYRTWVVRDAITTQAGWTRSKLKQQGMTETLYGLGWVAVVVLSFHLYSFLERS